MIIFDDGCASEILQGDAEALPVGLKLRHACVPRDIADDRRLVEIFSDRNAHGIWLTDVKTPADIEKTSALLRVAEADAGHDARIPIFARLDTVEAALTLESFGRPIDRLAGFIFDGPLLAAKLAVSPASRAIDAVRERMPLVGRASRSLLISVEAFEVVSAAAIDERQRWLKDEGFNGLCLQSRAVADIALGRTVA